ncbi:MAG: 4Fe-4S binding protein [Atopobiaceae bacterium]|nr:4Fe-4S binding protein [Atopobiaceae bacterium]MDO4404764.1 4Fe-4S binding protein [Atopobiaceae bacterium]
MSKPIINADECIACGACADGCPVGVLEVDDVAVAANPDDCVGCGACVDACPVGAIEIED